MKTTKVVYICCFILLIFLLISACTNSRDYRKIIENQVKAIKQLTKAAPVIDSDDASVWHYEYADSLLITIKTTKKIDFANLEKMYSAFAHIFNGMCYTRTLIGEASGSKYNLKERAGTLKLFRKYDSGANLYLLAKKEQAAIYSMINFYKASGDSRYTILFNPFKKEASELERLFKIKSKKEAYKVVSVTNKKIFIKTIVKLISDLYLQNNINTKKSVKRKYNENLNKMGQKLDAIPDEPKSILSMKEPEYTKNLGKCIEVQTQLIELLAKEIKALEKN